MSLRDIWLKKRNGRIFIKMHAKMFETGVGNIIKVLVRKYEGPSCPTSRVIPPSNLVAKSLHSLYVKGETNTIVLSRGVADAPSKR